MKVVLDTNVLLAAFIAQGACSDVFEHCLSHHTIVISSFIIEEFREKLRDKFHFSPEEIKGAVALLREQTVVTPIPLAARVCRDQDDDAILATALSGDCQCIVTGDKDLLVLNPYKTVAILTPSDFWRYEGSF